VKKSNFGFQVDTGCSDDHDLSIGFTEGRYSLFVYMNWEDADALIAEIRRNQRFEKRLKKAKTGEERSRIAQRFYNIKKSDLGKPIKKVSG
jgi:hypothetical protein